MKKSVFTPLAKLTLADLRGMVDALERRRGRHRVMDTARMSRSMLVEYLELMRPPEKVKVARAKRPRMPKNLGVGRYCRELLARVVEKTPDGLPVGLSYKKMVQSARRKFPDSCVDERHLRWYAAKMRREDQIIPVHRRRSKWQ